MVDIVVRDVNVSDPASIEPVAALSPTTDALITFEATPEFLAQFQAWKKAKMQEVLNYLHNNWGEVGVTMDRLVMMPQFEFPDRKRRNEYGQVAPGQTFTDSKGKMVPHPITGQPLIFTVWRKVNTPTATAVENASADKPTEIEPESTQPAIAAI